MDADWKRQLRREASLHHMCEENRAALSAVETKQDAIALYLKTIDWALEEGYPSIESLRRYFSDCEQEGVFLDKHFNGDVLTECQVYVFHNCSGSIRVGLNKEKKIIPMLYFANGCNMEIKGLPNTAMRIKVPLYVFGSNRISAEQSEDLICRTYEFEVK